MALSTAPTRQHQRVSLAHCRTSFAVAQAERGGEQGDYREGMQAKLANAIDCLRSEPLSKRATITFPFSVHGSETNDWTNQGMNKCRPLPGRRPAAATRTRPSRFHPI